MKELFMKVNTLQKFETKSIKAAVEIRYEAKKERKEEIGLMWDIKRAKEENVTNW